MGNQRSKPPTYTTASHENNWRLGRTKLEHDRWGAREWELREREPNRQRSMALLPWDPGAA